VIDEDVALPVHVAIELDQHPPLRPGEVGPRHDDARCIANHVLQLRGRQPTCMEQPAHHRFHRRPSPWVGQLQNRPGTRAATPARLPRELITEPLLLSRRTNDLVGDREQRRDLENGREVAPSPSKGGDRLPEPRGSLVVSQRQAMDPAVAAALRTTPSGDDQVHASVRAIHQRNRNAPQRSSGEVAGDGFRRCSHEHRRDAGIGDLTERPRQVRVAREPFETRLSQMPVVEAGGKRGGTSGRAGETDG
jgi:hypothetical protein